MADWRSQEEPPPRSQISAEIPVASAIFFARGYPAERRPESKSLKWPVEMSNVFAKLDLVLVFMILGVAKSEFYVKANLAFCRTNFSLFALQY